MECIRTRHGEIAYLASSTPSAGKVSALLIHGSGGEADNWRTVLDEFKALHPIALDMPGHGGSAGVPCSTAEEAAGIVDEVRMALGLGAVVVIGQSLGGAVAQAYARRHASTCVAAVVASSGCSFDIDPKRLLAIEQDWPSCIDHFAKGQVSARATLALQERARQMVAKRDPRAMVADLLACQRFDSRSWVHELAVPILILAGYEDTLTPLAKVLPLVDHAPRCQMTIFSPAGHCMKLEYPLRFVAAIESWLSAETVAGRTIPPSPFKRQTPP